MDFYHSTIVFLRIKKIDIPPSETLFDFFFFHRMLLDSSLLYQVETFRDSCFMKKKKKIISLSKRVTLAYISSVSDVCFPVCPSSKRSLTVETSHDGASSLVLEIPTRCGPRNSLVPAGKFSERENGSTPPKNSITADTPGLDHFCAYFGKRS